MPPKKATPAPVKQPAPPKKQPVAPPKQQPVLKPYTRQDCINGAQAHLRHENLKCGTDPDPSNAYCYRKNLNDFRSNVKRCP